MKTMTIQDLNKLNYSKQLDYAISYMALGGGQLEGDMHSEETGVGLDPKMFDRCMTIVKAWKLSFSTWLCGKPVKGGKPGEVHTKASALELANKIFVSKYNAETRAHQSEPIECYFTRNVLGPLEYGQGSFEGQNRLDEVQTDIVPNKREWTSPKRSKQIVGQMLVFLARGVEPRKVIRNCRNLKRMFAISAEQFNHIVEVAGGIHMEAIKAQQLSL